MHTTRNRILLFAECACWALGLIALGSWSASQIGFASSARHELARFDALRTLRQAEKDRTHVVGVGAAPPDQSKWSPERINAWRRSLLESSPGPIGVLRIRSIGLEVPILPGTEDRVLDRGVGHIDGTAQPGADGNIGIAGHRDGFFRVLKDITPGDEVEIETTEGRASYTVERTWIVEPEDVWVLAATPRPALTLVTCYPFYFIGPAPSRFIVRAVRTSDRALPTSERADRFTGTAAGGAVISF